MVRNEEDVIEHVVKHMLNNELDLVVVADNLSTDKTRSILDAIRDRRLVVVDDKDPAYRQSEKMTALANQWAEPGDWIIPFDADEVWGTRGGLSLADRLRIEEADVVVGYPWVHVPQWNDPKQSCPFLSIPKRVTSQEVWPKAALRWATGTIIEQGNHWTKSHLPDTFDVRHFQYRSYEHLVSKVTSGSAALALADLPEDSGAHWRQLASLPNGGLAGWWNEYARQPLVLDPPRCRA